MKRVVRRGGLRTVLTYWNRLWLALTPGDIQATIGVCGREIIQRHGKWRQFGDMQLLFFPVPVDEEDLSGDLFIVISSDPNELRGW